MANFGVRLAYPFPSSHATPAPHAAAAAPAFSGTTARLAVRLRRVLHGLLRAIDEAPYGLAWTPSPSGLSRPAWPLPAPAATHPAAVPVVRERRRAGRPLDDLVGRQMRRALA
jgi:hypothetical protein